MTAETIIAFQEVSKIYQEKTVVDQVSLAIHKGEFITILGTSGSGKTTTIASMIDRINRERSCHIVTIEDPIEYVHTDKKAIIITMAQQRNVKHLESVIDQIISALYQ